MSQNHASNHMEPVRHLSTVELYVLAIISSHKTLCSHHFTGLFGVITVMFNFPFVFLLLRPGCWAYPPAEDGAGRPQNLRTSSFIRMLFEVFVRLTRFVDLRASPGMQGLVQMFAGVSGFLFGTTVLLFLCFSACISWSFWNAGCLAFLWWWSYSEILLFGEELVAVLLSSR